MNSPSPIAKPWMQVHPSPFPSGRLASLYRCLFGVVSVLFAINTYRCRVLIYETPATFLTVLFLVWLLSGAAYLVHWPRFPIRAVNYLTAAYLIVSSEGVFNVECKFFIAMTFFNMGLRLRHGEEEQQLNRHIVHAMMLSFGAYLLLGGFLTKLQDEYWNSGIGLFHVVSLPWIAPEWIRSVLLLPWISDVCNWAALIIEGITFPLLLFRRTRKYGVICFVLFAGFLDGGLRISLIGWQAVAVAFLFMQILARPGSTETRPEPTPWKPRDKAVSIFYYVVVFAGIFIASADACGVTVPFAANWNRFNRITINVHYDILFTKAHFNSVDEYRVLIVDENGRTEEPVRVFAEDTLAGPESAGLLTSRWLQAEMYRVDRDRISPEGDIPAHIHRLVRFCLSRSQSESAPSKVRVLVRLVSLPAPEQIWYPLLEYDFITHQYNVFQPPGQ